MSQAIPDPDHRATDSATDDSAYASTLTLDEDPPLRAPRTVAVGAALALTVSGGPLGLLWSAVAPGVPVIRTESGAILAESQPEQFIAADGWFSLLGLGFGVLAAIGVWLLLRGLRGPVGLLVVVAGSIGAALVAWRLGRQIGLPGYERLRETAAVGQMLEKPADLRAGGFDWVLGVIPTLQGDVLIPAFAAAVTYTLLAGWSRWPSLHPELEPDPAVLSWDSVAPQAPPAAPGQPGPDAAEPPRG